MATWKEMGPEERYEVIQMAMNGKRPLKDLCEAFGTSRQTLKKAIARAREATMKSLEPQSPGRKSKPLDQKKVETLKAEKAALEKEVDRWKTKWEVTRTVLDLERKAARGEPLDGEGKKKSQLRNERKRQRKKN